MKSLLILIFLMLTQFVAFANPGGDPFKVAEQHFNRGEYKAALQHYGEVEEETTVILYKIAECYRLTFQYEKAAKAYELVMIREDIPAEAYRQHAMLLTNNGDYKRAIEQFKVYKREGGTLDVSRELNAVEWALANNKAESDFELTPSAIKAGSQLMGLAWYGSNVVYSYPFEEQVDDMVFFNYDLCYANEAQPTPKKLSPALSQLYYDGAACFSADGKTIYFTRNGSERKKIKGKHKGKEGINEAGQNILKIYTATNQNGAWGNVTLLNFNSDEYSCAYPTLSGDGKTMYFVSNQPGGQGGYDLYKTEWNGTAWSTPANMGQQLNSTADETSPFLSGDTVLYYSSRGLNGYGGFDVFASDLRKGNTAPENMKKGINSPKDDFCFLLSDSGSTGYLVSNREGANGGDRIYSFKEKIKWSKVRGMVIDKLTRRPIENAEILMAMQEKIQVFKPSDGKFEVDVQQSFEYVVNIEAEGYEEKIFRFTPTDTVIELEPLEMEATIVEDMVITFNDIYFAYDKADLKEPSKEVLDRLATFLQDNPEVKIELSAHTDSRASDSYNMRLSGKRAKSCVVYLTEVKQIPKERLKYKGFGETRLVNKCKNGVDCSEEEHQRNRRVEIRVL